MNVTNENAFKQLFHNYYENMCRYAFSYLKDEQSAEDVVQETFIKLWEHKQELLGTDNMRYYLITSVRNNCITYIRKQHNTIEVDAGTIAAIEPTLGQIKSIEQETQNENLQRIQTALNQLPPKCREVFLLVKMHGMSYKKCAETLGLSVKTIENQMGKAIKIFKSPVALCLLFVIKLKYIFP